MISEIKVLFFWPYSNNNRQTQKFKLVWLRHFHYIVTAIQLSLKWPLTHPRVELWRKLKDTNNAFRKSELLIKDQQHFRAKSAFVHADSWTSLW